MSLVETFVAASDYHGDRHDPVAAKLFKRFVKDFKPKHRLFLGDIWDFRAIRTNASEEEKRHSMLSDFRAGMGFLEEYKPHVILLGNHDQRLFDAISKDGLHKSGPLVDLAQIFREEFLELTGKLGAVVRPYDKRKNVFRQGGLKFVHGFDGMAPARMAAMYGNVLYGHGHAIESASAPTDDEPRTARMIGCLCDLNMVYARSQTATMKQAHGFAYGAFLGEKRHEVFQARISDGRLVYADRLKTITA